MKWLDTFIQRCYNRARIRDENSAIVGWDEPKQGRGRLGRGNSTPIGPVSSTRRVEYNYDDETVITFKVYGANGGKIIEAARYDEKRDTEGIRRYVISEEADLADSLAKIVTVEYMR
jgi:hypothetical protein